MRMTRLEKNSPESAGCVSLVSNKAVNHERVSAQLVSRLHHLQQLGGRVPVAEGHVLIDRHAGDAVQVALGCFADQPRKIEHTLSGKGFIHPFLYGDAFHGFFGCKRLLEKKDIIAISVWVPAESPWRIRDDIFHLLKGSHHYTRLIVKPLGEGSFDLFRQLGVRPCRAEQHIPALDISAHVLKTEVFETSLQIRHFEQIFATNIDTAQ
jgi:hypothetical protein